MPTIARRNRPSAEEDAVGTRRRDRVRDEEPEETPEPTPRSRRSREEEPDDEPTPRSRRTVAEEPDDDDEPPAPRRRGEKAAAVPEGVRSGWDGADETTKSGGDGSGVAWLKVDDKVELMAFLEDSPLLSYRQHWLEAAGEGKARPYLCPGAKCPVCGQGDRPGGSHLFNVLYLSGGAIPEVRVLQINDSAYKDLKEVFADKRTGHPNINEDGVYAAAKKTGKGFQTRTKFTKVKERDLQDDWDEIFEFFDFKDLPDMLDEAMQDLYTREEVAPKPTPRRDLEKLAKYLDEPDED